MIRTLRIQLTDECNLRCVFCCNEGTKNAFSIIKDKNLVRFILACYDVLGIKRIKFTGGEPLEYDGSIPNIIKCVNRSDIAYSIVTNATNYTAFNNVMSSDSNIEATISLPVPPSIEYAHLYKKITGAYDEVKAMREVFRCIDYLMEKKKRFKINYVLCNGKNTDEQLIGKMIDYINDKPNIQLRFLETAVNTTNNKNNRMSQYVFSVKDFENILVKLGYGDSVRNKIYDSRSYSEYKINNSKIKLIKFFCDISCVECPQDKTSLWLTSTGTIKRCSYLPSSSPINDWRYEKIAKQLEKEFLVAQRHS